MIEHVVRKINGRVKVWWVARIFGKEGRARGARRFNGSRPIIMEGQQKTTKGNKKLQN